MELSQCPVKRFRYAIYRTWFMGQADVYTEVEAWPSALKLAQVGPHAASAQQLSC